MAEGLVEALPGRGTVVEIGAGDGQFTEVLAPLLGHRLVVTEPTAVGCERLRARFPSLAVRTAPAESLPFAEQSLEAIVGCCTLDVLPDLRGAMEAMARRLRPGGVLAHILDMTTDLRGLLRATLDDGGVVVVPNVWSSSTSDRTEEWPEDLLLAHRADLEMVAKLARAEATSLRALLAARTTREVVAAFETVHGSASERRRFKQAFATALSSASTEERVVLERFSGQALSSGRLFAQRLEQAVPADLKVAKSELVVHSEPAPDRRWLRSILGFVQQGHGPDDAVAQRSLGAHVFLAVRQPMSMSSPESLP